MSATDAVSASRPGSNAGLAAAAIATQVLLALACIGGDVRITGLLGASTSSTPVSPGDALTDVLITWIALAACAWLLLPRSQEHGTGNCWRTVLWWAGIARASVIPVALLGSRWVVGRELGNIPVDIERFPPIDFAALGAPLISLCAAYALAVAVAIVVHVKVFERLTPAAQRGTGRPMVALVIALAASALAVYAVGKV